MRNCRIIETDNFGGDYPDETFLPLPNMTLVQAHAVADAINAACSGTTASRYWRVVDADYELQPGFEP